MLWTGCARARLDTVFKAPGLALNSQVAEVFVSIADVLMMHNKVTHHVLERGAVRWHSKMFMQQDRNK